MTSTKSDNETKMFEYVDLRSEMSELKIAAYNSSEFKNFQFGIPKIVSLLNLSSQSQGSNTGKLMYSGGQTSASYSIASHYSKITRYLAFIRGQILG